MTPINYSALKRESTARQRQRVRDRIYKTIAIVFMPQVSSAYAFLALSIASGIGKTSLDLLFSIVFASLIELASLIVYVRVLKRDPNVQDREDRPALFAVAVSSYLIGFLLLRYLRAPFIFSALMFAYIANTMFAALITRYVTKVSIHTWGITGPSVAVLYSLGVFGFLFMLIVGSVVGSTRIRLGYHTRGQVVLSFVTSIPLTWFIVYVIPEIVPGIFRSY